MSATAFFDTSVCSAASSILALVRSRTASPFLSAAAEERIVGGRIYDAHIAEVARQAHADVVVTDNVRHFTGLTRHGVRVAGAADFVREIED